MRRKARARICRRALASGGDMLSATLMAGDVPVTLEIAKTEAGRWLEGAEFLFEKGRIALEIPSPMDISAVSRVTLDDSTKAERAVPVEHPSPKPTSYIGSLSYLVVEHAPRASGARVAAIMSTLRISAILLSGFNPELTLPARRTSRT